MFSSKLCSKHQWQFRNQEESRHKSNWRMTLTATIRGVFCIINKIVFLSCTRNEFLKSLSCVAVAQGRVSCSTLCLITGTSPKGSQQNRWWDTEKLFFLAEQRAAACWLTAPQPAYVHLITQPQPKSKCPTAAGVSLNPFITRAN